MAETEKDRVARIKKFIGAIPDFPKEGITFRDIFPLLRQPNVFNECIDVMVDHIKAKFSTTTEVIVGLDSRGFIFGPLIALKLGCAFVPVRKAGKLPGKVFQVSYKLEYGEDKFEIQHDSVKEGQKVVIVDDLLATGGTLCAACELLTQVNAHIQECLVVIELVDLKGRKKVPSELHSLIEYEGE